MTSFCHRILKTVFERGLSICPRILPPITLPPYPLKNPVGTDQFAVNKLELIESPI